VLSAPVHVQHEAPTWVVQRHEHTWIVDISFRVVACEWFFLYSFEEVVWSIRALDRRDGIYGMLPP